MKKQPSIISSRRIPVLSPLEERVLIKIIQWADEYATAKAAGERLAHMKTPTTKSCSEHFNSGHGDMLALLNRMEEQ